MQAGGLWPRRGRTDGSIRLRVAAFLMFSLALKGASTDVARIGRLASGAGRYRTTGRVEMWRGGGRPGISVSAPFVWRCLSGSTMAPFPHPAHRTGHADLSHPALGQDLTPSPTTGRAQVGSDGRARSARRGTRVDMSRRGVA